MANFLATPAPASGARAFRFVCLAALGGDRIALSGDDVFGPGSAVQGGGGFVHFLAASPSTIVGAGSWSALSVASFVPTGAVFGVVVVAGVLTLNIELKPESGTQSRISAILEVICNVPIAGGSTGQAEGIRLTVSGNTFTQFGGLTALLTPE